MQFITIADYKPRKGYAPDPGDDVERDGYMTLQQQIDMMTDAGDRLAEWRRTSFPAGELGQNTPVFTNKLDAAISLRKLRAQYDLEVDTQTTAATAAAEKTASALLEAEVEKRVAAELLKQAEPGRPEGQPA